jgi:polyisoprenoid-binding protein YceI
MRTRFYGFVLATLVLASGLAATPVRAADDYGIDPVHSSVYFKISHIGLCHVFGRFNEFSGSFTIDPDDASKSSFTLSIKPESVDTNNKKRDEHLRTPDFFDVKQFPTLEFKSTGVKAIDGGYDVTGDLTMHGTTKQITFSLKGGAKAEFPKGKYRTGYSTDLTLKRSDFGMDKMLQALGDEVKVAISFEGVKN